MSRRLELSGLKDKIASKLNQQKLGKKEGKKKEVEKKEGKKKEEQKSRGLHSSQKNDGTVPADVGKKGSSTKTKGREEYQNTLRQEAFSLGATEEDFALVKGIMSDDDDEKSEIEFNDESDVEASLSKDLSTFMNGIGLGNSEVAVIDDHEAEKEEKRFDEESQKENDIEEEEEEEEEEEDGEDGEDDSEELAPAEEDVSDSTLEEEDAPELIENDGDIAKEARSDAIVIKEANLSNKKKEKMKEKENDEITDFSTVSSEKLLIPTQLEWYNIYPIPTVQPPKLDRFGRERLLERAKSTLEKENKTYLEEFASNNSQKKFLSQILTSGTLNDKISALTLLIQEAPLHNLKALDTLIAYCDKKSRTASLQSIAALKDLLLNGLLPDRKLLAFDKQPLKKDDTDAQLAVYYYEDTLKKTYFKLIQILEKLSQDSIVHVRINALTHIFDLLSSKSEQEVNLLKLGVNKLGDIDNKVASKASFLILQLEQAHPAMKKIITDAVIDVIFQSNNSDHSRYYGVTTLNQTIITRKEEELANTLVKTYFALFEKVLVETGSSIREENQASTIGKPIKGRKNNRKNFKKGKKGGKSVKLDEKTEQDIIEEKNSKLFSALLTGLNRAFPFSNLPNDIFQAHLNTLFKITHSTNFNTAIQALILINHIVTQQKLNSDRYYKTLYESLLDSRLVNTSKQGIYLNLLYKSLKNDKDNIPRVLAFVKRIMQVIAHWLNVGAISGMLFLLMELSKTIPEISTSLFRSGEAVLQKQKSEESIPSKEQEQGKEEEKGKEQEKEQEIAHDSYDPKKRDPQHANALNSSLWELNQFVNHYHPTVAIYAESFMNGTSQPKPDLGLYTLAHFLDRFVYKNAKQKAQTKGSSIMQPLGGVHTGDLLVKATNTLNKDLPANTENWLDKKITDIKADERFFYEYFTTKVNKLKNKKTEKANEGVDEEDIDDDDDGDMDDDAVWQALVKSKPDVEDISDDDGQFDFDEADFSDLDDDDEQEEEQIEEGEFGDNEFDHSFDLKNPEVSKKTQNEDDEDEDEDEDDEANYDSEDEEDNEIFNINNDDELSDSDVELQMLGNGEDYEGDESSEFDVEEEQESITEASNLGKKRARSDELEHDKSKDSNNKKKSKHQRLKDLPLFASAEDYAQYLE
ncbi:MAK21 [Candida oxycetoniae]|uniref:MAK21 n=1 Tax=Candida oxycetoniae TaxID=497107 RepID=A0AAI9T0V3_9ASCO|nr:MAK21 [Candida oxycetoniae]KAI3406166.2 MAK21 [Candida oxycetoniae]